MSIRIRNIEGLVEKIDEDAQWRKKEMLDLQLFCQNNSNPTSLLRASFVLCCAHFEGFIKYASNAYIAYISGQNIKGKDLRIEISSVLIRKKKHPSFGIPSTKKVKVTVVSEVLQAYDDMLEQYFFVKLNEDDLIPEVDEDDMPLPTEGNPTPDVLSDISKILGLNYDELFEMREAFIDSELLKPRHAVAHGERRPIKLDDLDAATDFVLDIIDKYKNSIIDAAQNNKHLRNGHQI